MGWITVDNMVPPNNTFTVVGSDGVANQFSPTERFIFEPCLYPYTYVSPNCGSAFIKLVTWQLYKYVYNLPGFGVINTYSGGSKCDDSCYGTVNHNLPYTYQYNFKILAPFNDTTDASAVCYVGSTYQMARLSIKVTSASIFFYREGMNCSNVSSVNQDNDNKITLRLPNDNTCRTTSSKIYPDNSTEFEDITSYVVVRTPPPPTPSPSPSCFPGSAQVDLASGEAIRMADLQVGQVVKVDDTTTSEVFLFTHQESENSLYPFIQLITADGALTLSEGHFVYVNDGLQMASNVKIGDNLMRLDGNTSAVTDIKSLELPGLYNPHTLHGDIGIDGFKVSTYTAAIDPVLSHLLLAPLRAIYTPSPAQPLPADK